MSRSFGKSPRFPVSEEIRSEIESILENLDIDLNIDSWKFTPNSDLYDGWVSIIDIDLVNNNSVRKVLEEVEYIREGVDRIEGVRFGSAFIRTRLDNRVNTTTINNLDHNLIYNILTGGNYPIKKKAEVLDYISQLNFLETPDKWELLIG